MFSGGWIQHSVWTKQSLTKVMVYGPGLAKDVNDCNHPGKFSTPENI